MPPLPSEAQDFMPLHNAKGPALNAKDQMGPIAYLHKIVAKVASFTALVTDSGKIFTNLGATGTVTVTLPAVADSTGVVIGLFAAAAYAFAATAPSGTLIADGNAAATTLTFGTASHIIGGMAWFYCDGTKWYGFAAGNLSAIPTIT